MPDLTANQHADAIIDALGGTTPADVAFSLAALLALAQRTEQAEAKAQHHLVGMEEAKVLWRGAEARAKQAEDDLEDALKERDQWEDNFAHADQERQAALARAEQAEKERDYAEERCRSFEAEADTLQRVVAERDGLKGALDTTMIAATRRAAERDRLAAALERLVHTAEWLLEPLRKQDEHRSASHAEAYAALDAAREALAASQEQT